MANFEMIKYYHDVDGMKLTSSVNNLGMGEWEINNLIIGYIGTDTLHINPNQTSSKMAIYVVVGC